jgi:hypothetical protein
MRGPAIGQEVGVAFEAEDGSVTVSPNHLNNNGNSNPEGLGLA